VGKRAGKALETTHLRSDASNETEFITPAPLKGVHFE
jgi:hypothetical protein